MGKQQQQQQHTSTLLISKGRCKGEAQLAIIKCVLCTYNVRPQAAPAKSVYTDSCEISYRAWHSTQARVYNAA